MVEKDDNDDNEKDDKTEDVKELINTTLKFSNTLKINVLEDFFVLQNAIICYTINTLELCHLDVFTPPPDYI